MNSQPGWNRREFVAASLGATAATSSFGASQELTSLTLKHASELVRRKEVSPVELTEACLKRIDRYNPTLNAFITIAREQALSTARDLEAEQRRGKWRGPLHGIPVALKDNIDTAGIRTTGGSELFKDRVPTEDAEVVRRLKAAGAIVIGKLNLHEFALGGTSAVTYFQPVQNPWKFDHHPGGSSGGNGAAIAADLCFGSLGTDTGGSIRIPAAYCGVVGLKPTAGRVSNRGVIPNSWTFDTVGPMCKCTEDAAVMLGAIAGYDALDPASTDSTVADYVRRIAARTSGLRLGTPRTPYFDNLDPEVAKAVEDALAILRKLVAEIRDIAIPVSPGLGDVSNAEIYAYHAPWIQKSPELYQEPTRRIVMGGANAKPETYLAGLRRVQIARREIVKTFASIDLLIMPTTSGTAGLIRPSQPPQTPAGPGAPPAGGAAGFRNTSYFSYYGLPAISVPCGLTASGLPIGLQICGGPFAEATVLALAHAYEQATQWHTKRPKLSQG